MRDDVFRRDEEYDTLPTPNLLEQLQGKNIINRARSLAALARRARQDRSLAGAVITAILDSDNKLKRLMGTISISHIGFGCLWEYGSVEDRAILHELLAQWPEPDRSDLLWFLKSQSIDSSSEIEP